MWGRALILGGAVVLLAAAPAHAGRAVLVAYGTGTTTCTVTVTKTDWAFSTYYNFSGHTECSVPVQQTGVATFADTSGGLCSGLRTTCDSEGGWEGEPNPGFVHYHVTLIAPFGQGWMLSPYSVTPAFGIPYPQATCSGIGSDHLDCTFTADNVLTVST
jgi:hypothetical protein